MARYQKKIQKIVPSAYYAPPAFIRRVGGRILSGDTLCRDDSGYMKSKSRGLNGSPTIPVQYNPGVKRGY